MADTRIEDFDSDDQTALSNFGDYLQIKSVHPKPDYDGCIAWVKKQAEELDLEFNIVRFPAPAEFTVWLTWRGKNPSLKSVMLNSHMDVVPVNMEKWTHDPFGGKIHANGDIYGRGTQDMKSVGVQYLEAIRRLKAKGFVPLRDIHVTFVPDEELGGKKGMAEFVKCPEFQTLNVGVELDEGGAWPKEDFLVFHGERAFWQINFKITGNTGHALMFIENTVGEKLQKILNRMLGLREDEKSRLATNKETLNLGDVTTVNMTMISGGVQPNVLPSQLNVTFDMRVTPHWSQTEAENFLDSVCAEAGTGVSYDFIMKANVLPNTPVDDSNPWWVEFQAACDDMGIELTPQICPGATDARYLRELGIPAFGFSPMNLTPVLLHDNDEYVSTSVFLRGVRIYESIIRRFASLPFALSSMPKIPQ